MDALFFPSTSSAESALKGAGFSIGTNQRDDPRGLLFGDFDVQKWRNLSGEDRQALDGALTRTAPGPDAAVKVFINHPVLPDALEAFKALGETGQ